MMPETPCVEHENQIQDLARKTSSLETRADYKDKRIDELSKKMDKMEEKLDTINENVNKIVQSSIQSDNALEIRLTKIETDMDNQKAEAQRRTVWIGIALTILTILINVYFNIIH